MRSTLLSPSRTLRLSALALVGATLLSACGTDEPVAPKTVEVPTAANGARVPAGTLIWKAMNTGKVMLLGGATFKVKGPANTTWTLTDNVLPDGDPVSGQFKLAGLSPGSYEVCEIIAPPDYLLPEWACHPTMVYDGATTLVETFISKRKPTIVVWFQDLMKNPVVGATIIVKDSLGNQILIATDNAWQDHDATAGKIVVKLPAAMKGSMCMFTPPVGYIFGYPPDKLCMPFALAGDMGAGFGPYPVLPIPSASWSLTNGSLGNLGYTVLGVPGATFKVTNPKLLSSIDVVDNGANDLDATVGKVLVKLPMAGTYNLCEVLPPVGYLSATPACRKVDVTSGLSTNAGWFINPEKPVISS